LHISGTIEWNAGETSKKTSSPRHVLLRKCEQRGHCGREHDRAPALVLLGRRLAVPAPKQECLHGGGEVSVELSSGAGRPGRGRGREEVRRRSRESAPVVAGLDGGERGGGGGGEGVLGGRRGGERRRPGVQ
jgi:hypothetical protein